MIVILKSLADNPDFLRKIEKQLPTLIKEFEVIKELRNLEVSDDNFVLAVNTFYNLFSFIPLPAPHLDSFEMPFFRARPNTKNALYDKQTDISYNSKWKEIRPGRFNRPKESVFYAALPFESNEINPSLTACLETCKGLTDLNDPVKLKDFTISRWKICKPFYVVNFCFDEEHLRTNLPIKRQTEKFLKDLTDNLSTEASSFIEEFLTYFSVMSGRRSPTRNEYYILTAMFCAIRDYYDDIGVKMHGLIYPSAMTEAKGLNIVLTTAAVDQHLYPDKVAMYRFILDGNTYQADPCSDAVDIKDGKFTIANFKPLDQEQAYTLDCEPTNGKLRHAK